MEDIIGDGVILHHTKVKHLKLRWASHCFPIEIAGRHYFLEMIAGPSINYDKKNRKTIGGTQYPSLSDKAD